MANIDGDTQRRVTLTASEEEIIEFSDYVHDISIQVDGGIVYFKFNGTISGVDDLTANVIADGGSFETHKGAEITELHLFSESAATVQWHTEG